MAETQNPQNVQDEGQGGLDVMDQVVMVADEALASLTGDLSGLDLSSVVHDYLVPIIRNLATINRELAAGVKDAFAFSAEIYEEVQAVSSSNDNSSLAAISRDDFESLARVLIHVFDVTQDRQVVIPAVVSQSVMGLLSRISASMTAVELLQSAEPVRVPYDQITVSSVTPLAQAGVLPEVPAASEAQPEPGSGTTVQLTPGGTGDAPAV